MYFGGMLHSLRTTMLLAFVSVVPFMHAQDPVRSGQVGERMAQVRAQGTRSVPVELFTAVPRTAESDALWRDACTRASVLRYNTSVAAQLLRSRQPFISLSLADGAGPLTLDLERVEILADGFGVRRASDGALLSAPPALHYRGVVRGVPGSLVSVSVFEKEMMALIGDGDDDRVIGRFENDMEGLHVFYREGDLRERSGAVCSTPDAPVVQDHLEARNRGMAKTIRCVRLYWEAANDLYVNKGSVANVTTYLTGLFNQMATLYANDGINVLLNEIFVWDVASPYNATSSSGRLNQFGTTRTSFNGELAHLIDLGGYGGVAWLGTLCSSSTNLRMAYSGINTNYSNVPTYSWSVEVVTHETGHNLGSRHTHACAWNGDNTAIDGCGPAAGYTEGTCANGPIPSSAVGGTIMSYCHLVSAGIRFANGFGPQPAQLIRDRVNAGTCLQQCGTSCDAPTPLGVTNLNATTATLTWANYGVVSYTLRWKPVSGSTWTTITGLTGTSYALTGLTQNVQYEFQMLSVCASTSSAFSASRTFTTPVPCPDSGEPNNSTGASTLIVLPAAVNALVASSVDADYYRFVLTATSTINISLSNVADDYDLRLLNGSGTAVASSTNGGTSAEFISYANATAGTYYVHVFGYNGVFNTSQCYALNVSAFVACAAPQAVSSSAITYNGATINWTALQGASAYDLRWKPTSASTWTDVLGLTTNSYVLGGLAATTSYDVQVRTVCGGGGGQGTVSDYSTTHTFITTEAPCEVVPRTVVSAKVILDGAYRTANSLMVDSLRKQNHLPLTEPYSAMGHSVSGPLTTTPSVLAVTGNNAVVDWVLVELRATTSPYAVLEARVGLVQRDGDVVAPDGVSPLGFCQNAGNYRIAVRHRNHLGAMSGANIALGAGATVVDFTSSSFSTFGTNARRAVGSVRTLWSGNVVANTELKYVGDGNDRDPILSAIGGSVPTSTATGYLMSDVNLDGQAKYVGADNDRDPILTNIGGTVPTSILSEQLP